MSASNQVLPELSFSILGLGNAHGRLNNPCRECGGFGWHPAFDGKDGRIVCARCNGCGADPERRESVQCQKCGGTGVALEQPVWGSVITSLPSQRGYLAEVPTMKKQTVQFSWLYRSEEDRETNLRDAKEMVGGEYVEVIPDPGRRCSCQS